MTLVEFLAKLASPTWRDRCIAAMYWNAHFHDVRAMTTSEVKALLVSARVPGAKKANIADVLNKAGALVDAIESNGPGGRHWALTPTGETAARALAGLPETQPEVEHGVEELRKVAAKIADPLAKAYIDEAILCLSVNALRPAIVFTWVGAVAVIKDRVWAYGPQAVTAVVQKYNAKKTISKLDDLGTIQESTLLEVARDLGVVDKGQWTILHQCLDTRNQCGHPNRYQPGVKKAQAHIEDIAGILF